MATQHPNDDVNKSPESDGLTQPKKSIFTSNLLAMLVLFVIAVAEMLVVYFYVLPSPTAVKAAIEETAKQDTKIQPLYKPSVDESMQDEEREEVDLGEFTYMESDTTSVPVRLSIHFYGLINKKDRDEYSKRYEIHKNRIRNAILIILRSSKQSDITDPSLGMIKNKVMVKVNEILGMPLIKGVIYTDIAVQTGG